MVLYRNSVNISDTAVFAQTFAGMRNRKNLLRHKYLFIVNIVWKVLVTFYILLS